MKKKGWIFILCSLFFLLAGCWDQDEIEEVGFVIGLAIDPEDDLEENQARDKDEHQEKFRVTYQIAVPGLLAEEAGQGTGEAFLNMVSTGMTNFKNNRELSARNSRHAGYEHLRVIIINEKLARQGILEHLLDFYIRDHEMRRRTLVLVSEGEAKDILEHEVPLEDMSAMFIEMINENHSLVNQMKSPTNVGQISERAIGKRSYLIQRVLPHGKDDIKVTGAAVFMGSDNRMIGWLGDEDVAGYNWIMGEAENGILEVEREDEGGFVFELDEMGTEITFEREGEQDVFDVEIRAEGYFVENWLHKVDLEDQKFLDELEEDIVNSIEEQANHTLDKMQNELYADIFDFKELVKREKYDYWEEIRDEWDGEGNPFSEAEIKVTAKVEIRHYMLLEGLEQPD